MKLIKLNKKEAKLAEAETTPISNLINFTSKSKANKELQNSIFKMYSWKYTKEHKFRKNLGTTKQNKAHISQQLGQPLYHANYEYREAVWGFKFKTTRVICYYSTKGLSIQVDESCPVKEATAILKIICNKLKK